ASARSSKQPDYSHKEREYDDAGDKPQPEHEGKDQQGDQPRVPNGEGKSSHLVVALVVTPGLPRGAEGTDAPEMRPEKEDRAQHEDANEDHVPEGAGED